MIRIANTWVAAWRFAAALVSSIGTKPPPVARPNDTGRGPATRRVLFTCIAAVFAVSHASAGSCTSYGCLGLVEEIFVTASGEARVKITGDLSLVACTQQYPGYFTISGTAPGARTIHAMVLMAQASGRETYLRASSGSSSCEVLYSTLKP